MSTLEGRRRFRRRQSTKRTLNGGRSIEQVSQPSSATLPIVAIAFLAALVHSQVGEIAGYFAIFLLLAFGALLKIVDLPVAVALTMPYMLYVNIGAKVNLALVDFILPALLAVVLANAVGATGKREWYASPLTVGLPVLIACFASALFAMARNIVPFEGGSFFLDVFKLVICMALFFSLIPILIRVFERADYRFLLAWVASAFSVSVFATVDFLRDGATLSRETGSFEDPNLFGTYLIISIGVALALGSILGSNLPALSCIPLLAAVVGTGSRGTLASLCLLAVLVLLLAPSRDIRAKLAQYATVAIVAVIVVANYRKIPAIERIVAQPDGLESESRIALWRLAGVLWSESPVFGIGLGQFAANVQTYLPVGPGVVVHNTLLNIGVSLGLVGLLVLGAPFVTIVFHLLISRRSNGPAAYLGLAIVAAMPLFLTLDIQFSRFVWGYMAMAVAILATVRGKTQAEEASQLTSEKRTHRYGQTWVEDRGRNE